MDVVPGGRERGRERRGSDGRKGVRQRGREGGMEQGLDKQGVVLRIQILLHGDGGQGHKGRWQKGEQHKMSNLWNKGVWMESTRHPHSVICALATLARFPTNLHTGHTDFLTHRYTGHTHCLHCCWSPERGGGRRRVRGGRGHPPSLPAGTAALICQGPRSPTRWRSCGGD